MSDVNLPIVHFNPSEVAAFGNRVVRAILMAETVRDEATTALAAAEKAGEFIDLELIKTAMHLHSEGKIDAFDVFGDKNRTSQLYRAFLLEVGVLAKHISDTDKVVYEFTDPELRGMFYYDAALKEQNQAEYDERHRRRTRLNMRLARVMKAAVAMIDAQATVEDFRYDTDDKGNTVPVITKGPKEVMGKQTEVVLRSTKTNPVEGASTTPTIAGLVKVADAQHRPASKDEIEAAGQKPGETTTTTSEEDFLATGNTLLRLIAQRETHFSRSEAQLLKNILTAIKEAGIK